VQTQVPPIAVVGVSALFPGSTDATGFWRDILSGRDLITEVPPSHWLIDDYYDADPNAPDKTYCKRGAFLEKVPFDPMEFGIPPNIVPATDTAQLLALIVAQKVLEDATQGQFASMDRERTSVILGVTSAQELLGQMVSRLQKPIWIKALRESGIPEDEAQKICERMSAHYVPWQESTFPGLLGNVVAGRIANRFDLRGTNAVTDAACASSLSALSMAVNELALGQSDLVISGGVDTMNDIFMYMCFSKTPALSRSGDCRPFSDKADGTMLGEGMAMLALKRLADAEGDGDRIYAVVRGIGASSDGRSKSVYAPLPEGQARAIRRAYDAAGYGPATVELVEAHGTGTEAGDVAEFAGLRMVFDAARPGRTQWCALGSVKSQIGHTKAAAGAAGLFKAIMALHHKVLPPTIKIDKPNPKLEVEASAFYLNTEARPWVRDMTEHPRRASVSSFGFGGSNFHVTLEEYVGPNKAWRLRVAPTELVVLAAQTVPELTQQCRALAKQAQERSLAAIARESQLRFIPHAAARLALVAEGAKELAAKAEQAAEAMKPAQPFSAPGLHFACARAGGQVAFLFPGQGSQYIRMGADLAMTEPAAREVWDTVAGLSLGGRTLHEVVFPRSVFEGAEREAQQNELTATEWAQPAIGAVSLALLRVLEAAGVEAECVAGHSFGELTALAAAGVFDTTVLVQIARRRGELMRDAASVPGAMLAVTRSVEEIRQLLAQWSADVVVANHNHPTQVVLSGSTEAIAALESRLSAQGIEARRLSVATAFHSPLVAASSTPFRTFLQSVSVRAPQIDVYSNAEAAPYPRDPDAVRERLAAQIARPVRFVEQIEAMWTSGVRVFLEVGPGSVLTELVGRILGTRPHVAIPLDRKGRNGVTMLQEGLGRLAVAGVPVDFAALWSPYAPASDAGRKKPALSISICGINYGKPYPPAGGARELPPASPPRSAETPAPAVAQLAWPPANGHASAPANGHANGPANGHASGRAESDPAQSDYEKKMAESHAAFLRAVEESLAGLNAMISGMKGAPTAAAAILPAPVLEPPTVVPAPAAPPPAAQAAPAAPAPAVVPTPDLQDLQALLLSVVAEKTGYPAAMLSLHMELEGDLGIDSIKRVEILSAIREREPHLPEVDGAAMAQLRTLGQIVEFMRGHSSSPASAPVPEPTAMPATAPVAPAAPASDLQALLLDVVAEKTGYPAPMLGLHMELEGDLGIDSIKRVEILSAIREREPGLPEVDGAAMAQLRTLGQIVEFMRASSGGAAITPSAPIAPAAPDPEPEPAQHPAGPTAAPAAGSDLQALLLDVVAEKTGYPAEMLGLHMELEGDLGIDSIKRVEILSAIREREPGLPEVDGSAMAQLRTLGQIVEFMSARSAVAPSAPAPVSADDPVERFVVTAVPAAPVGLAAFGLFSGRRAVVTSEGRGIAQQVAQRLHARGIAAEVVESVPADADVVLFLGGLREVTGIDAALAVNREAFQAAKAVAASMAERGGLFVTVQDTGGDFGLSGGDATRAWLSGVAGLARTAAVEWPKASVRALDVECGGRTPEAIAEAIVEELLSGGASREIGLRSDGRRITLRAVKKAGVRGTPPVSPSSVIVASGGGRGVTALAVVELARRHRPKLVLLGRTPLADEPTAVAGITDDAQMKRALLDAALRAGTKPAPLELAAQVANIQANREIRGTLEAIHAAGGQARYVACNVQDPQQLRSALESTRREWGPITGIVHGAGVLADKLIVEKTPEQFQRVFDTKVLGLRALLEATENDPLSLLALFSSVTARTGNNGQVDYAMANEILNKVAAVERQRRRIVVKAIGWGPWECGMVTPALKARFKEKGITLIPLADGARAFVGEICGSPDEVETVLAGARGATPPWPVVLELRVNARSAPYLGDHRIAGRPVVPVVMAVEWMARAASACRPQRAVVAIKDVKVLRGIKLDDYDGAGHVLFVRAKPGANGSSNSVAVELRSGGPDGPVHYTATAEMDEPRTPAPSRPAAAHLGAWNDIVYDGRVLFHGPDFQAIRSVDGIAQDGIAGRLAGAKELGWSGGFATDPAMLDGGLQLAVLWSKQVLSGASLPMKVGALHLYEPGLPSGEIQCVVHGSQVHDCRAVCDVTFAHLDGKVVAELKGVETILRPDERLA
jgi:acyl transferase domain-containing protein